MPRRPWQLGSSIPIRSSQQLINEDNPPWSLDIQVLRPLARPWRLESRGSMRWGCLGALVVMVPRSSSRACRPGSSRIKSPRLSRRLGELVTGCGKAPWSPGSVARDQRVGVLERGRGGESGPPGKEQSRGVRSENPKKNRYTPLTRLIPRLHDNKKSGLCGRTWKSLGVAQGRQTARV